MLYRYIMSQIRLFGSLCVEHVISILLPSPGEIRLGDFGLLVIHRIVYFGVVFDLVFQKCINSRTYVFSNCNCSLIEFMAILFSMRFLNMYQVESSQIESNKKDKTKLTPLPVVSSELNYRAVMFARFVCALLGFVRTIFLQNSKKIWGIIC